jgi:hypothetical protein
LTASYSEYHSDEQRSYLDWKVKEWGIFCSHVAPVKDPRGYTGACFYTYASRLFHPYWVLFYPKGSGDKEFGNLDPTSIDALSVAVWFMDDGSRTESYARFSVGPDKRSQNIQLQILKQFGITASVYKSDKKGDCSIFIDGRTDFSRFVDLVSPYLVEGMDYKLKVKVRKAGPAPRDIVTLEKVTEFLGRGLTNAAIAKILGVPRSSLRRHMDRLGFSPMPSGRPAKKSKKEYDLDTAEALIKTLNQTAPDFVDQVLKVLNNTVQPSLSISKQKAEHDWNMLIASCTRVEENTIVGITSSGSKFCNSFFPYLFEAYRYGNPSVYAAWHDVNKLEAAIKYQLRVGDPVTPKRVFKALRLIIRAPTNFRPCVAKALAETYCPKDGLVLDPCAGYGGRVCGVMAAGRKYIGIEPHPKAKLAFDSLKDIVGPFIFYNAPFEDVDLGDLRVNLVLTSLPYYSVERYSNDITQSWVRYKTWPAWIQGFLSPFISKSYQHLFSGGFLVVNTKNVQIGKHQYPIADELIKLASNTGFLLRDILSLPIGMTSKQLRSEPIYVFCKSV